MLVSEFMTPDPARVDEEATPEDALQLMDELNVRHLPVLAEGHLAGIVSDRDLLTWTGWRLLGARRDERGTRPLGEVMRRNPISVGPEEPARSALVEMLAHRIGCVPVVERGSLVGIVTEADLLRLFLAEVGASESPEDWNPPTGDVATPRATCVSPEATLAQVDDLVHAKGHRHLPVVRDGALLGMLSDRDLRRARGADLDPDARVESLMMRHVFSVTGRAPLSEAAELMLRHKVSALPVTGDDGPGILAVEDVLAHGLRVIEGGASG